MDAIHALTRGGRGGSVLARAWFNRCSSALSLLALERREGVGESSVLCVKFIAELTHGALGGLVKSDAPTVVVLGQTEGASDVFGPLGKAGKLDTFEGDVAGGLDRG